MEFARTAGSRHLTCVDDLTEAPMRLTARCYAVAVMLMLIAPAVYGQYPQRRDGFWIGFGLGYGSANVSCDGGVTGFVKLGGAPSRNLLIGGAINGWTHSSGGVNETIANLTASVYYYPPATGGLFVTGGLGFSTYYVDTDPEVSATGRGFTGGVGYDIRVGRNVSLTPAVNFVFGALEDFDAPAPGGGVVRATGWKQNVIDFGLGVTFH